MAVSDARRQRIEREDVARQPMRGRGRARAPTWTIVAVLALVATVHIAVAVTVAQGRHTLDHDEVISHMEASGHTDNFSADSAKDAGTWVPASQLRGYLELDGHSGLAETRRNLADDDIHPPMYFWALFGVRSAGFGIRSSGLLLNTIVVLLAGALLFFLLIEVLDDRLLAALAVAVFGFSAALINATQFARQYPMLMLASVLLIWATSRLLRKPTSLRHLFAFAAVGAFGLLVYTNFVFALLGACIVVAVRCFANKRGVLSVLLAAAASALIAVAVFPSYLKQYRTLEARPTNTASLAGRAHTWVRGLYDYITVGSVDRFIRPALDPVVVVFAVVAIATAPWWYRRAWNTMQRRPVALAALGVGGVALVGATAAYVLGRSPRHAYGWQYIILFWPAIVLVFAALVAKAARPALILVLVAALLGTYAVQWDRHARIANKDQRRGAAAMARATLVVSDCLERGYTPGAAMWMRGDTPVLLAGRRGTAVSPVPAGADRSRPYLLSGGPCPATQNADELLAKLGFVRDRPAGSVGEIDVFGLKPRTQ